VALVHRRMIWAIIPARGETIMAPLDLDRIVHSIAHRSRRTERNRSVPPPSVAFLLPRGSRGPVVTRAELFIFISFLFAGPRVRVMMASNNSCDWQISSGEHSMPVQRCSLGGWRSRVNVHRQSSGAPCPPCSWIILTLRVCSLHVLHTVAFLDTDNIT
jgi:hypothetical protein